MLGKYEWEDVGTLAYPEDFTTNSLSDLFQTKGLSTVNIYSNVIS